MKTGRAGKTTKVSGSAGSATKVYRIGTHRIISPTDTIARAKPHLAQMGITRIANVTGLDRIGIPVVMVTRPNSRSVAVSQGKGLDLDAAKASALMESIETWHAEHITHPLIYGTHDDLAENYNLSDPDELPQVAGSYFGATTRILWIEGINLIDQKGIWVPFEMVHADYTQPSPPGHGCFHCSTNGLASGNHVLEAQCHAICEVIERDATTLWHQMKPDERAGTRLDLESVDDPECAEIIDRIAAAGLELVVWETTSDVGVPAFYGLLINKDGTEQEHVGAGAGCHPSRAIALSRTLTEAVQTRLTYISGARDDLLEGEYSQAGILTKHHAARELISGEKAVRNFPEIPDQNFSAVQDDFEWLVDRLKSVGIKQVISVDLTNSKLDIPVVRVIIPGLEAPHDDDDYVPGPRSGSHS